MRKVVFLVFAASVLSCGGSGASFPDGADVKAAQTKWCDALAAASGQKEAWPSAGACHGVFPSASAGYVRAMTTCFQKRWGGVSDKSAGAGPVVQECSDEVVVEVGRQPGEDQSASLVDTRCARQKRCEKVELAECKKGFAALDAGQRALLTTVYNAGARARIADCLSSSSCGDDEEKARDACYKAETDKLIWLP